jgi:hypothetical protein
MIDQALGILPGAWWAWPVALVFYLVFRLWYDNWGGPLKPAEIDAFLAQMERSPTAGYTDPAVVRAFLEADDGREFVMSNLVRLHPEPQPHPVSGQPTKALVLMQIYVKRFLRVLVRHGGHPLLAMRKVGGYVDAWATPPDPGWTIVGAMRYRSRRDMMKLSLDPGLSDAHPFKTAATAMTFSFPAQVVVAFALRPRIWVALVLALIASLVHLLSVIRILV